MNQLDSLKIMLGLENTTEKDKTLGLILSFVSSRLLGVIKRELVPPELEWIVIEASIIRYNYLSSEGMSAHAVDGLSMTFKGDLLSDYMDDINRWIDENEEPPIDADGLVVFK